jgi:Fe-S cluster biogenesis protein NfuA
LAACSLNLFFLFTTRSAVADDKEFCKRVQQIGNLVEQIETIADPAVRATTKELVQLLMELHGTGLERMLGIAFQAGDAGRQIIDDLGRDPLVSSLLVLYGLHPEELASRVEEAIDRIRPGLRKQGCEVELLSANDGAIRVKVGLGAHTCASTGETVRSTVEEAIYDAAPDITSLTLEGLDRQPASGFVALEKLVGGTIPPRVAIDEPLAMSADGSD